MAENQNDSQSLRAFTPVLMLLAVCLFINYIDRGNLSIAAPLLKDELGISASQLGILLAAFFWTYTAMQFVSGWLVDRFDVNRVIATGFLLWSLATATTGLVRGFTILLVMRLLLGIGESVAFPSCSKILARDLPEHHRGVCEWCHCVCLSIWERSRDFRRRAVDGGTWVASGVHRNRAGKSAVAPGMDEVDAMQTSNG
jgi:sugar phosphate permease